uniref:Uncharacterized protein n=1 Tax=uncultured bacterium 9F08 TaxID=697051 RepID=D2XIQ3_9BACT|nr:hypothetical protein [uncultured bacterium 9F08]
MPIWRPSPMRLIVAGSTVSSPNPGMRRSCYRSWNRPSCSRKSNHSPVFSLLLGQMARCLHLNYLFLILFERK